MGLSHPFQFARVTGRTARVLKIFQFAESANPASVRGFSKIAVVMEEYLRVQSSALGLFLFLGAHSTGGDIEFR